MGLGNVDNTSDTDKPVSTAQATAIADAKKAGTDAQITANAALSNSGGTMTGVLTAQNNTSYTTKQVRNILLVAEGDELPASSNGDIILVYAP